MKKILTPCLILICCLIGPLAMARPTVKFDKTNITVSQTAGSVAIPYTLTGQLDDDSFAGTLDKITYYLNTQGVTAKSSTNYEGISKTEYSSDLSNYDGISYTDQISIPIYFTKLRYSTTFNVLLSPSSDSDLAIANGYQAATVASPSVITVTILGYTPPEAVIKTDLAKKIGNTIVKGKVYNASDSEIRKLTLKIGSAYFKVLGKSSWSTNPIRFPKKGRYLAELTVYLKTGETIYTKKYITRN